MITAWDKTYVQLAESVMAGTPQRAYRSSHRMICTHAVTALEQGLPLLTLRDFGLRKACEEAVSAVSVEDMHSVGQRARQALKVDQWMVAIHLLKSERLSRRVVVMCWNPALDCWIPELGEKPPRHSPELVCWHLWCEEDRLNISVFLRDCDVWHELPITATAVGIVQALVARHLEMEPGSLFLSVSHAYIYEAQRVQMRKLLSRYVDRASQRGGTNPNHQLSLVTDMLPAAMKGQPWVVQDLVLRIGEFYEGVKGEPIGGEGMAG